MESKRCPRCGLTYADPAAHFGKASDRKTGLKAYCKRCCAAYQRDYVNRPDVKARRYAIWKEYYRANIERERARRRGYSSKRYAERKRSAVRWAVTLRRMSKP